MKIFLKQTQLFLLFFAIAFSSLGVSFFYLNDYSLDDLPAPYLSNYFHFNEKMKFLRETDIEPVILVAGSSMGLANFHSKTLTERFGTDAHLNLSSQALTIEHLYPLLNIMNELYKPEMLIVSTNFYEFTNRHLLIDNELTANYLKEEKLEFSYHLRRFNLKYYIDHIPRVHNRQKGKIPYYDRHGTINQAVRDIDLSEIEGEPLIHTQHNYRYNYLEKLAYFCSKEGIQLVIVQSPHRKRVFNNLSETEKEVYTRHIEQIESILSAYGYLFINAQDKEWDDNLFTGSTHFNVNGAIKFTKFIADAINFETGNHF